MSGGDWMTIWLLTNYKRVLGELLEETFLGWPVDVEVQRLGGQQQSCEREKREQH